MTVRRHVRYAADDSDLFIEMSSLAGRDSPFTAALSDSLTPRVPRARAESPIAAGDKVLAGLHEFVLGGIGQGVRTLGGEFSRTGGLARKGVHDRR